MAHEERQVVGHKRRDQRLLRDLAEEGICPNPGPQGIEAAAQGVRRKVDIRRLGQRRASQLPEEAAPLALGARSQPGRSPQAGDDQLALDKRGVVP